MTIPFLMGSPKVITFGSLNYANTPTLEDNSVRRVIIFYQSLRGPEVTGDHAAVPGAEGDMHDVVGSLQHLVPQHGCRRP